MGYRITIGERETYTEGDGAETYTYVTAHETTHPDSPWQGDYSVHGNVRRPSCGAWKRFADEARLTGFFFHHEDGVMRECGGCFPLTPAHVEYLGMALCTYRRAHPNAIPGYEWIRERGYEPPTLTGTQSFDGTLERLIWLLWWCEWAVRECEHPVIANS